MFLGAMDIALGHWEFPPAVRPGARLHFRNGRRYLIWGPYSAHQCGWRVTSDNIVWRTLFWTVRALARLGGFVFWCSCKVAQEYLNPRTWPPGWWRIHAATHTEGEDIW